MMYGDFVKAVEAHYERQADQARPSLTKLVAVNGVTLGDLPKAELRFENAVAEYKAAKRNLDEIAAQLAQAKQEYQDIMLWKASASHGGWVTFPVDGRVVTQGWLVAAMNAEIGRLDTLVLALSMRHSEAKQRLAAAEEEKREADTDFDSYATLSMPGRGEISFRMSPANRDMLKEVLARVQSRAEVASVFSADEDDDSDERDWCPGCHNPDCSYC